MTTITVTPDLIERLGDLSKRIEFRDAQGRLLGAYHPVGKREGFVNPVDGSPCTEEEVQKLAELPLDGLTGRPLADILADLEARQ